MAQTVIGIDPGTAGIHAVAVSLAFGGGLEVVAARERPYPAPGRPDREQFDQTLAALLAETGLPGAQVVAGLPGDEVSLRTLEFPFNNPKTIQNAIPFALQDSLPFPVEEAVYDFAPAGASADGATRVTAVAIRATRVREELERYTRLGRNPRLLAARPQALRALIQLLPEERRAGRMLAVVDIGGRRTDVCIAGDEGAGPCRSLRFGGQDVTDAIADRLACEPAAADQIRRTAAFDRDPETAAPEQQAADRLVRESFQPLLRDLRITFRRHQSEAGRPPDGLLLTGGEADLPGLDGWLAGELGLPVERLTLPDRLEGRFAGALALAACAGPPARTRVANLRQGEFVFRGDWEHLRGRIAGLAFGVALLLVFLAVNVFSRWSIVRAEDARVKAEIASITKEVLGKEYDNPKVALSVMLGEIGKGGGGEGSLIPSPSLVELMFAALERMRPDKHPVEVQELSVARRKINIKAQVPQIQDIGGLVDELRQHPCFHKINQGPTRQNVEGTRVEFSLSIAVECLAGEEGKTEPVRQDGPVEGPDRPEWGSEPPARTAADPAPLPPAAGEVGQ